MLFGPPPPFFRRELGAARRWGVARAFAGRLHLDASGAYAPTGAGVKSCQIVKDQPASRLVE